MTSPINDDTQRFINMMMPALRVCAVASVLNAILSVGLFLAIVGGSSEALELVVLIHGDARLTAEVTVAGMLAQVVCVGLWGALYALYKTYSPQGPEMRLEAVLLLGVGGGSMWAFGMATALAVYCGVPMPLGLSAAVMTCLIPWTTLFGRYLALGKA